MSVPSCGEAWQNARASAIATLVTVLVRPLWNSQPRPLQLDRGPLRKSVNT